MQVNKRDTPPSYTGLLQLVRPLAPIESSLTSGQFFLLERSMDLMPPGVTYVLVLSLGTNRR